MELEEHTIMPFNSWRSRHEDRIDAARDELLGRNGIVAAWEKEAHRLMGVSGTKIDLPCQKRARQQLARASRR